MFMPFIQDLWLNIYKNKLKIVLNVHCKLWADNSILYDTAIYTGEYHEHLFQNPANQDMFSQTSMYLGKNANLHK